MEYMADHVHFFFALAAWQCKPLHCDCKGEDPKNVLLFVTGMLTKQLVL